MNTSSAVKLAAALLAVLPLAAVAAETDATAPCPSDPPVRMQPPDYAGKASAGAPAGKDPHVPLETVLLIDYDRCGRTTQVRVEKSSMDREFDQAAIAAAKTWRMPQQQENQPGTARVPVKYDPSVGGPAATLEALDPQTRNLLLAWRDMQVAKVALNADGSLPAYVPDPSPIAPGRVADVVAMLDRDGEVQEGATPTYRSVALPARGLVPEWWEVIDARQVFAVVRRRTVSDGEKSWAATSVLCEPRQHGACEELLGLLRDGEPQQPGTPPPTPPDYLLRLLEPGR